MITDASIYNRKNTARNQQEEVPSEMFLGILMKQRRCFNKKIYRDVRAEITKIQQQFSWNRLRFRRIVAEHLVYRFVSLKFRITGVKFKRNMGDTLREECCT